ncbi:hypothetical protein G7Y89_g13013 [Cudoniella acicularis]|uniref:Uncharacterized protein n=1 Tax=Cudoniella acicularis TaxID=354080 RepID=A0A8H4R9C0_9HELO|nr:hypothetical protein G7Y89_g13013 [Cudoniella acicularis]
MIMVRAIARLHLSKKPKSHIIPDKYELDWIATHLEYEPRDNSTGPRPFEHNEPRIEAQRRASEDSFKQNKTASGFYESPRLCKEESSQFQVKTPMDPSCRILQMAPSRVPKMVRDNDKRSRNVVAAAKSWAIPRQRLTQRILVKRTALYQAVKIRHEKVVQLLLEEGAKIQVQTINGWTTLHRAAMNGDEAIVRLLLDYKTDPDTKDSDRRTALSRAAETGTWQWCSCWRRSLKSHNDLAAL